MLNEEMIPLIVFHLLQLLCVILIHPGTSRYSLAAGPLPPFCTQYKSDAFIIPITSRHLLRRLFRVFRMRPAAYLLCAPQTHSSPKRNRSDGSLRDILFCYRFPLGVFFLSSASFDSTDIRSRIAYKGVVIDRVSVALARRIFANSAARDPAVRRRPAALHGGPRQGTRGCFGQARSPRRAADLPGGEPFVFCLLRWLPQPSQRERATTTRGSASSALHARSRGGDRWASGGSRSELISGLK